MRSVLYGALTLQEGQENQVALPASDWEEAKIALVVTTRFKIIKKNLRMRRKKCISPLQNIRLGFATIYFCCQYENDENNSNCYESRSHF